MMRSQIDWLKLILEIRSMGISTPCLASTPVRKTTRDDVTTKCVNVQFKYWSRSQPAHRRPSTPQNHQTMSLPTFHDTHSRNNNGISVRMFLAKYHQCGRRSSAT